MRTKVALFGLLVFMMVVAMVGCSKSSGSETKAVSVPVKDEIVVGLLSEPQGWTHFESRNTSDLDMPVMYNIYDTLLYKDGVTGEVKPWLAESWKIAQDGKSITLKLHEGVKFHDGSEMTAEDVVFSFNKQEELNRSRIGMNFQQAEAIDKYTVVIYMFAPYGPVLNSMCSRGSNILSKAYFEKVGIQGYADNPIGTGPFKWASRTSGDRIVLERFEDHWKGPAFFKKVTLQTITDINTTMLALQSGDIDLVINAPIENLQFLNDPNAIWDSIASNASLFLSFNMLESRWVQSDLNFRKAVQCAINKDAINAAVFGGKGTIIDIIGAPAFTTRPVAGTYFTYTYDLDKAREYLKAANYNGQEFNVLVTAGTTAEKAAQVVQGSLQEAGINMKITATDNATFMDMASKTGNFDAQIVINTASVLDADAYWLYFAKERYSFPNLAYPRGERMNELAIGARNEPDNDKRLALWTELANIVNEDAYTIYILVDVNTVAYRKGLKGVKPHLAKYYRFWEWSY
jgi:peptide/nickel transport system substrate-binding protein